MGYRRTDDRRRLVFRGSLAGVAGMLLMVVAIAGCTGTTTSPAATLPTGGLAVAPTPLPPATLQDTAEPNPFATYIDAPTDTPAPSPLPTVSGRVLSWLTLQMPADLAAGIDSNFQNSLFGWSRGYLAFHGDLTSGSAVPWASSDGRVWQEGQALDMAGLSGGAQVEQVVEGPAGLLALGRVPGCADDGTGCMPTPATALWTSTDGLHWSRVDLKNAFGGGAVGDVAAGPKGYLAVSVSSATTASPAVWLSSDGRAWRAVSLSTSTFQGANLAQAEVVGDGFLVAGRTGSLVGSGGGSFPSTTPAIWWSADGSDWSRASLPNVAAFPEAEAAIAEVGAGKLVAHVGSWDCGCPPEGDTQAWTSSDGRAWKAAGGSFPSPAVVLTDGTQALQLVEADGVLSVAVSSDGFKWAQIAVSGSGSGPADSNDAAYGPVGLLVEGSDSSLWLATIS